MTPAILGQRLENQDNICFLVIERQSHELLAVFVHPGLGCRKVLGELIRKTSGSHSAGTALYCILDGLE